MTDRPRGGVFAGVLLLVLGLLLLAAQFVPQVRALDLWSAFPVVIGVAFLGGYVYSRQYGFLIPGCILTGLGLGLLVARLVPVHAIADTATVTGLGLGFLAIYPIDLAVRGREPGQWWPLVPGGIILLTGLAPALWQDVWQVAPALALIVIGFIILARALTPGASERSDERRARRVERHARRHGLPTDTVQAAAPGSAAAPSQRDGRTPDKIESPESMPPPDVKPTPPADESREASTDR